MFLLIWGLNSRDEAFYKALKTKWALLRKSLEPQGRKLGAKPVSAPALSQARSTAGDAPFYSLLKTGNTKHLEKHDSITRFKGYRLYAMDGSSLNLHSNDELEEAFDRPHSTGKNKALPQASFTTLQLVDTGWISDYRIGKCDDSELHQTIDLARSLIKGDLLLGDRLSFDTVWFATMVLLNIEMAMVSPPFGMCLFVMQGVTPEDTKITDIYLSVVPFLICDLIVMALILAFPTIALWLPSLMR